MTTKNYLVTNEFTDAMTGKQVLPGDIIEADQKRHAALVAADVIGDEVAEGEGGKLPQIPKHTADEFAALSADEQRAELARLDITGDDSNADKRAGLYAAYLEANGKEA
ncbi:hypothetical protein [Cohnella sp. GbtcB17]|uniref:hypothetical protein n=1 Tax=Cohnella sp. GbtcB17 TaxID=2824762 RepID=UPI001C2FD3CE|nr:hypothetical protein [Cohnella sp. GbtcB17]